MSITLAAMNESRPLVGSSQNKMGGLVRTLKDLFRENFYSTIRFYTLRTSKIH